MHKLGQTILSLGVTKLLVSGCPVLGLRVAAYGLRLAEVAHLKLGRATTHLENRVCRLH